MRICCFSALLACFGLYCCASSAIAQQLPPKVPHVSGYVLDSVSRAPISNVLVQVNGEVVRTNKKGWFFISSPSNYPFRLGVVATVHTVYYGGRATVKGTDSNDSLKVLLKRNAFRFQSISCLPANDSTNVNPYAEPFLAHEWHPGSQSAFYIKNERGQLLGNMRSITFDVSKLRLDGPSEPFQLRIYQVDSIQQRPGDDLLTERVVLCFTKSWFPKTNFITYNVSAFNIPVPANGFFIAFERIVTGDHYYPCPPKELLLGENYVPTGEILRAPCAFAECRTWKKGWERSGDVNLMSSWKPLPAIDNCWPLYESAISIEADRKIK